MNHAPPDSLVALLSAPDDAARDRAWDSFISDHSGLIMHVARANGGDHDAIMDRYVFVIEALRENECRRLHRYGSDESAKFTTWLIVVARRLCLDLYRIRYGRSQSDAVIAADRHRERRQLADLVGSEIEIDNLEAADQQDPEAQLRSKELSEKLTAALDALNVDDRLLLRFRFQDGLSVPRIARLVGAESPFSIYRRIEKILREIRKVLEQAGVSEPLP